MVKIICAAMMITMFSGCNLRTWLNNFTSKDKATTSTKELKNVTMLENAKQFTKFIANPKPTIVMVHSTWCSSCKIMEPIFSKLADELNDAKCGIINLDQAPELAKKYVLPGVPVFLVFQNGTELSKPETRPTGDMSLDNLRQKIDEVFSEFHS